MLITILRTAVLGATGEANWYGAIKAAEMIADNCSREIDQSIIETQLLYTWQIKKTTTMLMSMMLICSSSRWVVVATVLAHRPHTNNSSKQQPISP